MFLTHFTNSMKRRRTMKAPNLDNPSKPSSKNDNNSNSKSICQNHLKAPLEDVEVPKKT